MSDSPAPAPTTERSASLRLRTIAGCVVVCVGLAVVTFSLFMIWERSYYADEPLSSQTVEISSPIQWLNETQFNTQQQGSDPGAVIMALSALWGPSLLILGSLALALWHEVMLARIIGISVALLGMLFGNLWTFNFLDDSGRIHVYTNAMAIYLIGYGGAIMGLLLMPRRNQARSLAQQPVGV